VACSSSQSKQGFDDRTTHKVAIQCLLISACYSLQRRSCAPQLVYILSHTVPPLYHVRGKKASVSPDQFKVRALFFNDGIIGQPAQSTNMLSPVVSYTIVVWLGF